MSRKQKKYHFIYKTTCKITGKFYIGMHSSDSLEDGYLGSGKILGYSRHKYGDENHTREILEMCVSREQLKSREREIVNEEILKDPLNINLKYGGNGGWDHINNDEKKRIEIQIRRSSAGGLAGSKKFPKGSPQAINRSKLAGITRKRLFKEGIHVPGKPFLNKKHSEKTKQQMRISQIGKQVGEKNSQFGKMWITDGISNTKIQKTSPIPIGWKKGRIIKNKESHK